MRPLYDTLRKAILGLDGCVTEEVKKLYVAYKAETNFVDVIAQANRLRLSLNIKLTELDDSKEVAVDVANKGRWGNGSVEVDIKTAEEIPYVLGLIRQALDSQLDSVEA